VDIPWPPSVLHQTSLPLLGPCALPSACALPPVLDCLRECYQLNKLMGAEADSTGSGRGKGIGARWNRCTG
jgi:hypothetical protein